MYFTGFNDILPSYDFRSIGIRLSTILQTLCQMANETVTSELIAFNAIEFVTTFALSRSTFNTQISTLIQQFQQQTVNSFLVMLQLVRTSIQMNQFIVCGSTNAYSMVFRKSND